MAERGVGRLLTSAERQTWPDGPLRSGFVIDGRHVLTAWHCVDRVGGTSARLWLRLHGDTGRVDVPVAYVDHVADLDAAVLALDEQRADGVEELRRHLESVALPLGADVQAYEEVRIAGFPQLNPAVQTVVLVGKVSSAAAVVGGRRAIRLHVPEMAAAYGESPQGMSGGPLLRRGPGGVERVVGIVYAFPPSPTGAGTLGGEVLCRQIADLRDAFPAVADALRPAIADALRPAPADALRPAAADALHPSTGEPLRPSAGDPLPDRGVELSSDVVDRYRPILTAAEIRPPAHWTERELAAIADTIDAPSRAAHAVLALRRAAAAKAVCAGIGVHAAELSRLHSIYQREVGAWPAGASLDALLVEAADVHAHERATGTGLPLGALARFVVGVAAAVGAEPAAQSAFVEWIGDLGHQLADAARLYAERRSTGAWLLLDLGDEPLPGEPPWPAVVGWTYVSTGPDVVGQISCDRTPDGLLQALRAVLRAVPPAWPLIVDLAVPHALLCEGIEEWPVYEVDGELEPFSEWGRPRLRWSRRRRQPALQRRLVERTGQARWEAIPDPLPEDLLSDHPRLRERIRAERHQPWLLGGAPPDRADTLRILLREGCGFVVWFPSGLQPAQHDRIRAAVAGVSAPARRHALPDELPRFTGFRPAVIWDDPRGRDQFSLPPLAAAESIT
ncbi:trypsin-like peptidase domain-containing protein [Dactylosporangium siamense]|uniref:Serine protease n=1 Tax=Dactylosporangium siamense TaxID=685454 RepID=A0A919UAP7_9ACTN|nr:trypsin-like peptidase domain-containing protein [Dactylosporangium siamense]GIG43858.1 hypothetical protein Dsi01nite_018990 [Dactylosporangium siamense]